jgi:hypothetical protein
MSNERKKPIPPTGLVQDAAAYYEACRIIRCQRSHKSNNLPAKAKRLNAARKLVDEYLANH